MAEDIKDVSTRGALVAIAIALIVVATVMTFGIFGDYAGGRPDSDKYQAVTLTGGTTIFGQLQGTGNKYVTLSNVYTPQNTAQDPKASPKLTLVPRDKGAFWKPVATMRINSDQIVAWEDLSDDSPVTKFINEQNDKK